MTKITITCSCGCGRTIPRSERVIRNSTTGLFFSSQKCAGAYYHKTEYQRKPQQRGFVRGAEA